MAYTRFRAPSANDPGSDTYLYLDIDGTVHCCMCRFPENDPNFGPDQIDEMRAHVARHRAAGHVVPDGVEDAIEAGLRDVEVK